MPALHRQSVSASAALILLSVALSVLGCQSIPVDSGNEPAYRPCLYVIGDSTVASYPPERYPLTGWGQVLPELFDRDHIDIVNAARSGRSSKSFCEEGAWDPIRDQLRKGDYVFIQFGHNDSKKADLARYTEPYTSYQRHLLQYVVETRDRGAVPVLVTPIYRNAWEPNGRVKDTHGAYPPAMRTLAHRENVPLLDLHARTKERFQALGPERTRKLFLNCKKGVYPAYPDGKTDNTHPCEAGAREICRMIAAGLATLDLGLNTFLKADAAALHSPDGRQPPHGGAGTRGVRYSGHGVRRDSARGGTGGGRLCVSLRPQRAAIQSYGWPAWTGRFGAP